VTAIEIESFCARLLSWYASHGRSFPWRAPAAPLFEQIVSEVLLQRTTATVVGAFLPSFVEKFPTWEAIAAASEDDLGDSLRPIGLWRRRATSLRHLAVELVRRHSVYPATREELESLPAVGQYVASAILLFAHDEAEPLLDGNMARVLERYFGPRKLADIRYDPYLQGLAKAVVRANAKEVNWAILDLGNLVCRIRNPLCTECPLLAGCRTGRAALGIDTDESS
jgi:A/G-specific adenine glycosylase